METINQILFNANFFNEFDHLITLLYQTNGPNPPIQISDRNLFTFIKRFNDIIRCQNFITDNDRKTFTLFTLDQNISTWLWNHNPIPNNLQEIIMFCLDQEDIHYYTDYTRPYTTKITNVITFDQLERHLLVSGMNYLGNISLNLEEDDPRQLVLEEHIEKLRLASSHALSQASDNNNNNST